MVMMVGSLYDVRQTSFMSFIHTYGIVLWSTSYGVTWRKNWAKFQEKWKMLGRKS